jgi:hypothetical protein
VEKENRFIEEDCLVNWVSPPIYDTYPDDKCFLVLFHTPLFILVNPLALLISMHFTCFVCFVINRPLHHVLIKGAIGHEVKRSS